MFLKIIKKGFNKLIVQKFRWFVEETAFSENFYSFWNLFLDKIVLVIWIFVFRLVLSFEFVYKTTNAEINSNLTFAKIYGIWLPMYISNPVVQSWELNALFGDFEIKGCFKFRLYRFIIVILSNLRAEPQNRVA